MATTRKRTDDAYTIARQRFVDGNPEAERLLEDVQQELAIARTIYELRVAAGLSQKQLADRAGTTAAVVGRIEEGDGDGQASLALLQRIAAALGYRARILIEPLAAQLTTAPGKAGAAADQRASSAEPSTRKPKRKNPAPATEGKGQKTTQRSG